MLSLPLTPPRARAAASNVFHKTFYGGVADLRPMPRTLIDEGPQRAVYRYRSEGVERGDALPVLFVPPLAAPALCFDLRRGCSLAEHLVGTGRPTYLVDYGDISFNDRDLGIEHWVDEVVPRALAVVSEHAGGRPVHIVAWCLGGIFSLLTAADQPALPIASISTVASPFDVNAVPLVAPLRPLVNLTGGRGVTVIYRALGGAPRPLVKKAFQFSALDKYLTKPMAVLSRLDDTEFLAQLEAVDRFTDNMIAYPGRTFGQLYHHFLRANDLAEGGIDLAGRHIDVAKVSAPVLVVAGDGDGIAPKAAVHHLVDLLTGSPDVRYEVCPGGHLGVLAGRGARATTWPLLDEWMDGHET